ncbi:sensor domain-containing diguanylate cyclase [Paenibacillus sp. UNC451MF]|uniref:sensor domain-containing diguanylate cyclase n=1 Tax=Paenibacillus sp. UNC451MF TaxID=1449063 RepID=UPI00068E2D89|nr:sensor domain-containing diguanylate cyclase [Paenibacillus sp. UNC451MF]
MDIGCMVNETVFKYLAEQNNEWIQLIQLDGATAYMSPAFHKLLGVHPLKLPSFRFDQYISDMDKAAFGQAFYRLVREHIPFILEYRYLLPDGTYVWVEGKACMLYEDGQPVLVGIIARDIHKYKVMEKELTQLAYYDVLTGLPNRRLFQDRYTQSLLHAKRYKSQLTVLYMDLDDFKSINDQYGHAVGDELLCKVASRLAHCVRDPDTICRLGGDEFVILLQQCATKQDIANIANRIHQAINQRFYIQQHEIFITCSMGAAMFPQDGFDESTLLHRADAAMYQAKQQGKNYFQF